MFKKISSKISLLSISSVLITAVTLVWIAVGQSRSYNKLSHNEVNKLIDDNLSNITQGVYNLVQTENEAVQQQVSRNLDVMDHLLEILRGISLSEDFFSWNAINQYTGNISEIKLPRIFIGQKHLEITYDFKEEVSLVDLVTHLTGATATIFQRMNEKGDMLRVATTVPTKTNNRAISTYIPAINPDGRQNPVIKTILADKIYNGVAYVVNQNYITSYKALKDENGRIIGMFYVGVQLKEAENRIRKAILNTKVGKTGYVYVISGKGEEKGKYIISKNAEQDGVNVLNTTDSDGNYIIQNIINKGLENRPDKFATYRYRWQNPGETSPRWKIVKIVYYEPWNWLIGTSVYEDELEIYKLVLDKGRKKMTETMMLIGLFIILFVSISSLLLTLSITRPIKIITAAAKNISRGSFDKIKHTSTGDEVGILIDTFNFMSVKLKETLKFLQDSEEKYRDIFEKAPGGLFRSSEERFIDVNPALAKMFGYLSPEEMLEQVTDIGSQIFVREKQLKSLLEKIYKHEKVQGYEAEVKRKNGSLFFLSITVKKITAKDGSISYEGSAEDITKRKEAETALRESEEKFRQIADNVNEGFAIFDMYDNQNIYMNTAFKKIYCCEEEGRIFIENFYKKVHEKDKDTFANSYYKNEVNSFQHRILCNGELRWIRNRIFPVKDGNGSVYRIVNIISDITEYKKSAETAEQQQKQLIQADKMVSLGVLVSGVAHEINNPNNFIMLNINLIRDIWKGAVPILDNYYKENGDFILGGINYPDIRDDILPLIDGVLNGSKRIQKIVAHLKNYARQEEYDTHKQVDLNEVVSAAVSLLSNMIYKKTNNFYLSLTDSPIIIHGNFQRIEQVLINLIQNSCDALTDKKNKITLSTAIDKEKNCARIIVEDEGSGISEENLKKIKDPFFTTKRNIGGTGLGLSVSTGIVKDHHGELIFQSLPEKGTKAILLLPLKGER